MRPAARWMERHQVVLFVMAIAVGAALGLGVPDAAGPAGRALTPALALLMYATFLGVPFAALGRAFHDGRFLLAVLAVNFVAVPLVVWLLSRSVAADEALLVGVLLVLLTPCVDYVIVFTGLAGGAKERLLAATPLLMLAQMILLPLYLWIFMGARFIGTFSPGPFVDAFVLLILAPLTAAALTQYASRWRAGVVVRQVMLSGMVPIMMATLVAVVASQIGAVGIRIGALLVVVPVFVVFAAVMVAVGLVAGRAARLDVPGRRAVVFSGVTRNSLVVLPLALAAPASLALAPMVVVAQTLVELIVMVILVRVVPWLVPDPDGRRNADGGAGQSAAPPV